MIMKKNMAGGGVHPEFYYVDPPLRLADSVGAAVDWNLTTPFFYEKISAVLQSTKNLTRCWLISF